MQFFTLGAMTIASLLASTDVVLATEVANSKIADLSSASAATGRDNSHDNQANVGGNFGLTLTSMLQTFMNNDEMKKPAN
ncbi:unnamed protein product [Phytophthora fragariaefolia]|uniref:Unnamed protein product n=1 Tax=Phytophthora fragariaefolia TaxID=1490495 RepID=A0A9W7DAM7_9STRA|nr:unnamed protein product [Phytophthora fragariaefolia]